jgi:hypothetical protein
MGLFYAIFFGILGIIIIARIASKSIPRAERLTESPPPRAIQKTEGVESDRNDEVSHLEALVSLLVKRGVITEDELLEEISRAENYKDID